MQDSAKVFHFAACLVALAPRIAKRRISSWAARAVDLVELVPGAELAADRVPQQFHQFDPLDRGDGDSNLLARRCPTMRRAQSAR